MPESIRIECPDSDGSGEMHGLNITHWGDGKNPNVLICVHGLTRNSSDFDFLAEDLASEYRVICPDVAGRGKSEYLKDPSQYNYVTYVADMLHVMQQLGVNQCDFVGTSMGGLIGMMIAANVPGVIKKLVMNDIGPFISKDGLKRIGEFVGSAPDFANKEGVRKYFAETCKPWGIADEKFVEHIAENSVYEDGEVFKVAYDPHIGDVFKEDFDDVDLWPVWEQVTCPVLLLRGEKSDILPVDVAEKMTEGGKAELQTFEDVGHVPSLMEQKHIELIKDWLK